MENDLAPQKDSFKWIDILTLVSKCPAKVKSLDGLVDVSITGATRLVLWTLAHHLNGVNMKTTVLEQTIREETRADSKTVDRAVKALKSTGIVSTTQIIRSNGTFANNIWTIDRALLEKLVGEKQSDAALIVALSVVKDTGEAAIWTPAARVQETRSRLYLLAGDFRISIEGEAFPGNSQALLTIRSAEPEKNTKKETASESTAPVIEELLRKAPKLTRAEAQKMALDLERTHGTDLTYFAVRESRASRLAEAIAAGKATSVLDAVAASIIVAAKNNLAHEMDANKGTALFVVPGDFSTEERQRLMRVIRSIHGNDFVVSDPILCSSGEWQFEIKLNKAK